MSHTVQHPAYSDAVTRGQPARATIGTTTYDLDDEGYIAAEAFADEADAAAAMNRLGEVYGVEYDGDGEVVGPADATEQTEDAGDTDEGDAEAADTSGDDTGDNPAADAAGDDDTLSRDDLEALGDDDLRERAREHPDVDTDEIDLRKKAEMVAALVKADAENVDNDADGTEQ